MGPSARIGWAMFAAFVIFVTMRGELAQYLGLLGIGPSALPTRDISAPASSSGGSSGSKTDILSTAAAVASFF